MRDALESHRRKRLLAYDSEGCPALHFRHQLISAVDQLAIHAFAADDAGDDLGVASAMRENQCPAFPAFKSRHRI